MKPNVITRFAPSPTGLLHLGHAYSALFAYDLAERANGHFILRIEDIDITRRRPEFIEAIYRDLEWLGLRWEKPVRQQSKCFDIYEQQLKKLQNLGVIYPCYCSRKEIIQGRDEMLHAPHHHINNYPQICKKRSPTEIENLIRQGRVPAYRLYLEKALSMVDSPPFWSDLHQGKQAIDLTSIGDIILARRDIKTSYHLAVTYDDNDQDISLITRGADLSGLTPLHILLQKLLGYKTPYYAHHDLVLGEDKKRLATSRGALSLQSLRHQGISVTDIRKQVGAHGKRWNNMLEVILSIYI